MVIICIELYLRASFGEGFDELLRASFREDKTPMGAPTVVAFGRHSYKVGEIKCNHGFLCKSRVGIRVFFALASWCCKNCLFTEARSIAVSCILLPAEYPQTHVEGRWRA